MPGAALWRQQIDRAGFAVVPGVFPKPDIAKLLAELSAALGEATDGPAMRPRAGVVVAARNVLELFPPAATLWQRAPLLELLSAVLGADYGLVRVLFFDKPPDRSWSLAWHKDLTIAVRENRLPTETFARPTNKAGVPHVEASQELLEQMLTLRIHLDDVDDENGTLRVIPGSHRDGKHARDGGCEPAAIHAQAGDVLAMRPLVSHSSGGSAPGTRRHRRILHLEFAGWPVLPDGYAWHHFIAPSRPTSAG